MALFSTDESVLYSSLHGRQRREERHIAKATLVLARRYGMKETEPKSGREKYTYGGVTFIYDPITRTEITSYASSDYASPISGTRNTFPIFPRRKYGDREPIERLQHAQYRTKLFQSRQWTSHTVIVVDISGSMRTDDVDGARCRSDGVWLSLAKDFVETAIQSKKAKPSDVISVICMGEKATVVLRCEPTDYVLFNIFLDFREWDIIRPEGPGRYRPALEAAEGLLRQYDTRKQALALIFVSDGAPSDGGDFRSRMGNIAKEFGRRLSITCVGMGNDDERDFQILQEMVSEAQAFHANATFYRAGLDTASLTSIFTCLSSFTALSKLEMTRIESATSHLTVRSGVLRERSDAPDDLKVDEGWTVYKSSSLRNGVIRVWSWDRVKDDFVCLLDPRCLVCFSVVANCETMEADPEKGTLCGVCKACFVCHSCRESPELYRRHSSLECKQYLKKRRRGEIVIKSLPSFSIAIKNAFFSEGVERMVAKTRFIDKDKEFVGKKMVAKQSRFVEEDNSYEARMDYHRQFLRTQSISSAMANKFNEALQRHSDYFNGRIPRIRFLDPFVFELADDKEQEMNQLVEEMIEGRYEKFNNNMGFVRRDAQRGLYCSEEDGMCFPFYTESKQTTHSLSTRVNNLFQGLGNLAPVQEEQKLSETNKIDAYEMVQAFSHFTFEASRQNLIVVDLQGTLAMDNDPPEVILTDPAINTRSKTTNLSSLNLGRTDRGDKGIASFFHTHDCGPTCKLLHLSSQEYLAT